MGFPLLQADFTRLMADIDPQRCAELRHRALLFSADFIHFFADDGAAVPFVAA